MSFFGTSASQSVAGLSQAERIEVRDKRPQASKSASRRGRKDESDLVVVQTEAAEAVRGLKDNGQEETHEDRQEHSQYTPGGTLSHGPSRRRLDVEG